ncbi:hypothetical protein AAY473_017179 [Plecturocebus cupreus]
MWFHRVAQDGLELLSSSPALSPRLEGSSMIVTHRSLDLLGSGGPLTSASQIGRPTSTGLHTEIIFKYFVEMRSCYVGQAGLKHLGSSNSSPSASQSVGFTGMSHCAWPGLAFF